MAANTQKQSGYSLVSDAPYPPVLYGTDGKDSYTFTGQVPVKVNTLAGDDRVEDFSTGVAQVFLGDGNDRYYGGESVKNSVVHGGRGDDSLFLSIGGDGCHVYGDGGNDSFFVYYTLGTVGKNNLLNGGAGRDTIEFEVVLEAADGVVINLDKQWAYREWSYSKVKQIYKIVGFENAIGSDGNDTLVGNALANELHGGDGADILKGMGGNDILYGGDSTGLFAGTVDRLYGGAGKDILIGGAGADILQGDAGADTFRFEVVTDSTASARDIIKDFSRAQKDRIDLAQIDANTLVKGDQAFKFIGSSLFTKTAGELNFRSGLLSGDVDGDGKADFQVKLIGVTSLFTSDFLL